MRSGYEYHVPLRVFVASCLVFLLVAAKPLQETTVDFRVEPGRPAEKNSYMKITNCLIAALVLARGLVAQAAEPEVKIPPSATTAAKALADSPRHGEWADIAVPGSDVKIHTWIVYPERKDKAPVLLVIHEIFGMTDWVRAVADQAAAEGFIAVAPDLLSGMGPGGGGTDSFTADGVRQAIGKLSNEEVAKRLDAVRAHALAFPAAATKSGTVGFCWGGSASFMYATHQPALNAAVVYYGTPPKPDEMANIPCPVLGLYGGDDARVSATVPATAKAMSELKKTYTPHIFDGAGHSFLRQQDGRNGANLRASQQGWAETVTLLKKSLE